MCGPLVTATAQTKMQLALYQMGRFIGYLLLGFVAGLAGEHFLVSYGPSLNMIFTSLLAGFFVFLGVRFFMKKPLHFNLPPALQKISRKFIPGGNLPNARSFMVGLFSIFLPCGFLYAVVLACMSFKSTTLGILSMGAFWLGTLPAMSFAPYAVRKILQPLSFRHPYMTGLFFVMLGLITVLWRFQYSQTHCPFCH